jgi:hypothetical protein
VILSGDAARIIARGRLRGRSSIVGVAALVSQDDLRIPEALRGCDKVWTFG